MKTTIDIADGLLRQLRALASRRNTTMRAIVEAALRETLAKQDRPHPIEPIEAPTFMGKGLQGGKSWDDWGAIRTAIYEGRGG